MVLQEEGSESELLRGERERRDALRNDAEEEKERDIRGTGLCEEEQRAEFIEDNGGVLGSATGPGRGELEDKSVGDTREDEAESGVGLADKGEVLEGFDGVEKPKGDQLGGVLRREGKLEAKAGHGDCDSEGKGGLRAEASQTESGDPEADIDVGDNDEYPERAGM